MVGWTKCTQICIPGALIFTDMNKKICICMVVFPLDFKRERETQREPPKLIFLGVYIWQVRDFCVWNGGREGDNEITFWGVTTIRQILPVDLAHIHSEQPGCP